MNPQDLFVGGMAALVGALLALAAALGFDAPFQLPKMKWLEAKIGRGAARAFLVLLGAGLIVLGVLIAVGYRPFGE